MSPEPLLVMGRLLKRALVLAREKCATRRLCCQEETGWLVALWVWWHGRVRQQPATRVLD